MSNKQEVTKPTWNSDKCYEDDITGLCEEGRKASLKGDI